MKLVNALFKQDPVQRELKKMNLTTDNLTVDVIGKCLKLFEQKSKESAIVQQSFLKTIIKHLEEKGTYSKKLKIMMVLIEISKISKYDICDIILNKKIKVFIKPSKFKHNEIEPKLQNLDSFICQELLIPLYNYLMKLSMNEELYHTCMQGQIPFDDIFRRGTKIRFIWIFKLYNIINVLAPILSSAIKLMQLNPSLNFFNECATFLFNDISLMNNFIIKALSEASSDNFILMPYFDMLQFYQSLKEQLNVGKMVNSIYIGLGGTCQKLIKPMQLNIAKEEIEEIEIQALRVQLISNTLKNPKKDHTILETEYNEKIEQKQRRPLKTQPTLFNDHQDFKSKWKHLD